MKAASHADVYRVISDPNRRKILELLHEGDRPVQSFQPHLNITLGAISQHLQLMRRVGVVSRSKVGKQRFYHLEAERLREIDDWLSRFREFWEDRMDRFGDYLDRTAR